jgi:hypothetical protein
MVRFGEKLNFMFKGKEETIFISGFNAENFNKIG